MVKCPYSELLGRVGEGIHSYRICNIAIVDVIMTIVGGILLRNLYFKETEYYIVISSIFILGIILHRLFCVRTTIDKFLFPNN